MTRIAVLGTGAMGTRIAGRLLNAGHTVTVYNRTPENARPLLAQGAKFAAKPKAAAAQADVVIGVVTDDEASKSIWCDPQTGAAQGLRPAAIAIESSTLTLAWTQELASKIERCGAMFLDAPVVGSRPQAEAGTLTYLVGGQADACERVAPIFQAVGKDVLYLGATGRGMAMKLAVNALFGIQVAAVAELLGLLDKQDIAPDAAIACLSQLLVTSPAAVLAGQLMVAEQHAPLFPIALVEKDLRYLLATTTQPEAAVPTTAAVYEVYRQAIAEGYGTHNITGVAQRDRKSVV